MPEVDPWNEDEVGRIQERMDRFGIEPLSEVESLLPDHRFVSRDILFGHRGMKPFLETLKEGGRAAVITGIMPSGEMHMGHKVVVDTVKMLQEAGAEVTLVVADIEAYNTREMSMEDTRSIAIDQYLRNYVALGLDMDDVDFYFQSEAGNRHHVMSKRFSRYVTQNEFESTYGDASPAKVTSSFTQYADILRPQFDSPCPTTVPVGIDQDPHIRLAREVARKHPEGFHKPASLYNRFMRGLTGGKMSSSKPKSYISLTDSVEEAKQKIDNAKTGGQDSLEEHRSKGGDVSEDMVFELLAYHLVEDDSELERIRREYESGEMLSGELKQIAKNTIEEFLVEHQRKREEAEPVVEQILEEG